MTRYVVLLRGLNLGSRNRVAMADLRGACASAGCTDVASYIQSGNVVLTSDLDEIPLRERLEEAIRHVTGVSTTAMVRTAPEMAAVVADCPFAEADGEALHVAFCHERQDAARLGEAAVLPEKVAAVGREVYLYLPNGLGRSPLLTALQRRTTGPSTVRNWRTVSRLAQMVAD